jgi:hypothetical protein
MLIPLMDHMPGNCCGFIAYLCTLLYQVKASHGNTLVGASVWRV